MLPIGFQIGEIPRQRSLSGHDDRRKNSSVLTQGMEMLMPTPLAFLLALVFLAGGLGWYALRKNYNLKLAIKDWFVLEASRPRRPG